MGAGGPAKACTTVTKTVPYFIDHLSFVRLPVGLNFDTGLRRGQCGAVYSIASHFTLPQTEPAIVVMPTGSGKTGVMMLTPFLLEARRTLIVTPSRLVRSQITEQVRQLSLLRATGVVDPSLTTWPSVHEVERRIIAIEDWKALEPFDVVVGVPNGVSPGYKEIPTPPEDLFDLIIVDEAHHSPAHTWNVLLQSFPNARRVLFTATPFRQDSQEIQGKIIYSYPVRSAIEDRIFGALTYVPVTPSAAGTDEANDVLIARQTEEVFRADRAAGYKHSVIVRVDSQKRADALVETYRTQTNLRLKPVHSRLQYSTIRRTIKALEAGELDGIICVNMLGEGFDFPNLKIAAVHAPHRSLAVTLQFIGRFARTNSDHIGAAKFLAVPNDIQIEAIEIYREDVVWQEIVPNLLERSIAEAIRTREVLQTFQPATSNIETDLSELSLFALTPFHHVKVYEVTGDVNLHADIRLGHGRSVALHHVSDEWNATIFITEDILRPRWANVAQLDEVRRELFIVHFNDEHGFLFVCSSVRSEPIYQQIVDLFCPHGAWTLTHGQTRKALHGLKNLEFFNVGLRNRVLNSTTESYRTMAGPGPDKGIRRNDGLNYHEGHVFGRAVDGDEDVTIGLSSLSKIWSNTSTSVPELLDWCDQLAERLAMDKSPVTGSRLDLLDVGHLATKIPENVITADWDNPTYTEPRQISFVNDAGQSVINQLLDLDIEVDAAQSTSDSVHFALVGEELSWPLEYRLNEQPHVHLVGENPKLILVGGSRRPFALIDYLNEHLPRFYFADFSSLQGRELLLPPTTELNPFDCDFN